MNFYFSWKFIDLSNPQEPLEHSELFLEYYKLIYPCIQPNWLTLVKDMFQKGVQFCLTHCKEWRKPFCPLLVCSKMFTAFKCLSSSNVYHPRIYLKRSDFLFERSFPCRIKELKPFRTKHFFHQVSMHCNKVSFQFACFLKKWRS